MTFLHRLFQRSLTFRVLLGVAVALVLLAVIWLWQARDPVIESATAVRDAGSAGTVAEGGAKSAGESGAKSAATVARGAYLARAGNCMGCHTARGGQPYAGGRVIPTPFGDFIGPNLTSDRATGLGQWSADDFWRALHHGRGRDGRFLYPAFPFTDYARIPRSDADALFAYLQSLPPVRNAVPEHRLGFPWNQRWLLGFWRVAYFHPEVHQDVPQRSAEWNRGAYLVNGLGHCNACHGVRNALGAVIGPPLSGGMVPMLDWHAPPLHSGPASSLSRTSQHDLVALLKDGVSPQGAVFGPMAEVVRDSLQHLSEADLHAMATYLKSLPPSPAVGPMTTSVPNREREGLMRAGGRLYEKHCVDCHGADGRGKGLQYPPLAGSSSVKGPPVNLIRVTLNGGFAPSTAGNPRPHGMPPFGPFLNDEEVAAVASYVRNAWGDDASLVSPVDVRKLRAVPVD